MVKNSVIGLVSIILVAGLVGIANAGNGNAKGIFESPMVDDLGIEVYGSECKIMRDGSCKLEMEVTLDADVCYVSFGDILSDEGGYFTGLAEYEDGEIKAEVANCIPPGVTLYWPYCMALCRDGGGNLIGSWINGLTVPDAID